MALEHMPIKSYDIFLVKAEDKGVQKQINLQGISKNILHIIIQKEFIGRYYTLISLRYFHFS